MVSLSAPMLLVVAALASRAYSIPMLEFFVMSRCPDTHRCETLFYESVLEAQNALVPKVSYIGSGTPGNFTCLHGQPECVGNMQQLCVREQYGQYASLRLALCQDIYGHCSVPDGWYPNFCIPSNTGSCANRTNTHVSEDCVSSLGPQLLEQSFSRTHDKGIRVSCTVQLSDANGRVIVPNCNVNGGVWDPSCSALGINTHTGTLDKSAFRKAVCAAATDFGRSTEYCKAA